MADDKTTDIESAKKECENKETPHIWINEKKLCVQNMNTIDIFLKKPLVSSLVIAIVAFIFSAFLYKIKGTPLEKSNAHDPKVGKYIKCSSIDTNKLLFTKAPQLGMVKDEAYKAGKKNKYGKIFWPWLSEYLYPPKPNRSAAKKGAQKGGDGEAKSGDKKEAGTLDVMYVWLVPFYLTLKWTTQLYYSAFANIKNLFYKANHWGSLGEISKINKKMWLTDFFVVFLCIPFFLFLIMPLLFVGILFISTIMAPMRAFVWNIRQSADIRKPPTDGVGKTIRVLLYIWWFLVYGFSGMIFGAVIFVLHLLWFLKIMVGAQETEADGLKTVKKTWANIIWDYRFIWAILAASLWLNNFRHYLLTPAAGDMGVNKSEGLLSFIQPDNQDMMMGIISGALILMLLVKQQKYFKNLSDKVPKSRDCGDCGAPDLSEEGDDKKSNKKCLNPDYDPKSTRLGKISSLIGDKVRKKFNANKADSTVAEEQRQQDNIKEKQSINST